MPRSNENVAKRVLAQPPERDEQHAPARRPSPPSTQRTGSRQPRGRRLGQPRPDRRRSRSSSASSSGATVAAEILPRTHGAIERRRRPDRPGRAGRLGASMGLFNKILHAGEGRKLKSLESIAPIVGAFEPEMQARSDDELRALTATLARAARPGRRRRQAAGAPRRPPPRGVRRGPRGRRRARSASATSTCRSWAAPRCTSAGSRR